MASHKNYSGNKNKHLKKKNFLDTPKKVDNSAENMSKNETMRVQMRKWTSFYRLNIHRFVEHYFQMDLFLFQKILLYFMNLNSFFMLIAARGLDDNR